MLLHGRIPEWPKGTDCKSAANCFGGSNPPPSICVHTQDAAVAELADAQDLKSCGGDIVPVRFRSAARKTSVFTGVFFVENRR